MKQTAVEWLEVQIFKIGQYELLALRELFEKAKQMEKEEQDKIYDHAFKYGQLSQLPGICNSQVIPVNPDIIREDGKVMALQNQSESKAIPELSDDEIIQKGIEHYKKIGYKFGVAKTDIWYMAIEWYREQLKSKQ